MNAIPCLSRVSGRKIPQAVTRGRLTPSSLSIPYRSAQTQHCTLGGPIPRWCMGPVSAPGENLCKKLLQVLAMATSRVDVSQHWTTSNFFSFVRSEKLSFWRRGMRGTEDYILFTRQLAIVVFHDSELWFSCCCLKKTQVKEIKYLHVLCGNENLNM